MGSALGAFTEDEKKHVGVSLGEGVIVSLPANSVYTPLEPAAEPPFERDEGFGIGGCLPEGASGFGGSAEDGGEGMLGQGLKRSKISTFRPPLTCRGGFA